MGHVDKAAASLPAAEYASRPLSLAGSTLYCCLNELPYTWQVVVSFARRGVERGGLRLVRSRVGRSLNSNGPDDCLILLIIAIDVEATRCVSHEHCLSHRNTRHMLCRGCELVNAPGETGKACCQEQALAGRVPGRCSERKPGLSASKETPSTGHNGEPCSTRTKTTDPDSRHPSMWMLLDWKNDVKARLRGSWRHARRG